MSPPDPVAEKLRAALTRRVGGFFHNARKDLGVACQVCAGPATEAVCGKCAGHRDEFGDRLANQVAILAYARGYAPGLHQSAHHVREYKAIPPAEKCAEDLAMMILAATYIHWRVLQGRVPGRSGIRSLSSRRKVGRVRSIRLRNLLGTSPCVMDPRTGSGCI